MGDGVGVLNVLFCIVEIQCMFFVVYKLRVYIFIRIVMGIFLGIKNGNV